VSEVEPDLKELLHRRAQDIRIPPDLPPPTLRRARRRRGWSVAFVGMTALAMITGVVVAFQLTSTTSRRIGESPSPLGPTEPTPVPPGTDSDFAVPSVWPETNLDDVRAEQAAVDGGADSWRTDPTETARRFAVSVLGWDQAVASQMYPDGVVPTDDGDAFVTAGPYASGHGLITGVTLDLSQRGRRGQGGIWSVVDVVPDVSGGIDLSCGTNPLVPGNPVTLCGTLSLPDPAESVRYGIFDGNRFDLSNFDDAPFQGTIVVGPDDQFRTEMAGPLSDQASVLFLEVIDGRGIVLTALARRLSPSGAQTSPPATIPPATTQPTGAPTTGCCGDGGENAFPGLWPAGSVDTFRFYEDEVAKGNRTWQLDASQTAQQFVSDVLGWPASDLQISTVFTSLDGSEAFATVASATVSSAAGVDAWEVIDLVRMGAPTPIWVATGARSKLFDVM
jgi:hypothetical protein